LETATRVVEFRYADAIDSVRVVRRQMSITWPVDFGDS